METIQCQMRRQWATRRVFTDSNGHVLGQRGMFPFGEVWYETGTVDKWKFTSYERDTETGNDYAMARFYINRLGRFGSADSYFELSSNPQNFNRYSYVLDDPTNRQDPQGLLIRICKYWIDLEIREVSPLFEILEDLCQRFPERSRQQHIELIATRLTERSREDEIGFFLVKGKATKDLTISDALAQLRLPGTWNVN